jgi:hypothetical protein
MLKYELLTRSNYEGTATQTDFEPTMRFNLVFGHKQEYVNDLLQLTLNAKAVRKLVFRYRRNWSSVS